MNVEIAERLASRRRDAGYSQETLAERLGVTRQAVSKWERSESSPDTDNLIALAKLYGVSLDELLNVDPSIEDDVAFEAADKASERRDSNSTSAAADPNSSDANGSDDKPGVHLVDDDGSYVNINWRDGVNVKDAKTGEEVHVGWKGIHIKSGNDESDRSKSWEDFEDWVDDDTDSDEDPVIIGYSIGNTNRSERKAARKRMRAWLKFPFFLLVIIAYVLVGFFAPPLSLATASISPWAYGLFLVALIPTYYMLVYAIGSRSPIRFIQGYYPFACVVFFLWMWLIMGIPHPSWVVFLSIPIVEWACETIRKSRRRRATVEAEAEAGVGAETEVEVEARPGNEMN
jgi:HTH-type transcriptional regulator/antitoxin HipB